jgi:hypothetical protein
MGRGLGYLAYANQALRTALAVLDESLINAEPNDQYLLEQFVPPWAVQ